MEEKEQETGGGRQDEQSRFPGFVVVDFQQGMLKALVIKAKLEEVGIPVFLDYESVGQTLGLTVDGLGEVHILVPDEFVEQASDVIAVHGPPDEEDVHASEE